MRVFAAIEIQPEIKSKMRRCAEELNANFGGLRTVKEENLHLTLKFIGPLGSSMAEKALDALSAVSGGTRPFPLQFSGLGVFPPSGPPAVIWAGVSGNGEIPALKSLVEDSLFALGIAKDAGNYLPHVTLARLKSRALSPPAGLRAAVEQAGAGKKFGSMLVRAMALFESRMEKDGVRYSRLGLIPFS